MIQENLLLYVMMKSISDLFVVVSVKTVQYILIELPYILLLVKSIHEIYSKTFFMTFEFNVFYI